MMEKQNMRETRNQSRNAEPLADLELSIGQAEQTKGGPRAGNDVLVGGGAGNDTVLVGAGLDVLIGNTGGDRLID